MTDAGWIPAYRRMFEPDHWLAPTARDPASRLHAWADLLQMATHRPRQTRQSGVLLRGELLVSLRTLAKRWRWHRSRVERFVNELEVRTAIGTARETPDGTVYRIVNYDTYAIGETSDRDSERDKNRDSGETGARQEQELEKEEKVKKTDKPPRPLARTVGVDSPPIWMHLIWNEELGSSQQLRLTAKRRQKYTALFEEQLKEAPDPKLAFRVILRAVKRSPHHMSERDYQMPESLFSDENRRDKWVQKTLHAIATAERHTEGAEKFAEFMKARRSHTNGNGAHP